jgi:ABC-type branched-subunit amino acid transport system ATPase component
MTGSDTMTAPAILQARNLGHAFGGLEVLKDVNFAVRSGHITGLIGPNGSGKTTCFNILSGFLRPRCGSVIYDGGDVTRNSVQGRSKDGLVRTFQTPLLFTHMSVLDNLMAGSYKATSCGPFRDMFRTPAARRDATLMYERAVEVADKFGLTPLLSRQAGTLPAGQMRVIELARAYAGRPRLLLLDEPSSGLNSSEIAVLRDWITELNREGLSILLVSHDMGLMTVTKEVHVLYYGEIIATGSMAAIQADARVRDAYLGM